MRMRMRALKITLAAAIVGARTVAAEGGGASESERYVWELSSIYGDDQAWEADRKAILAGIDRVPRLRGTMKASAAKLADALDEISRLRTAATRMTIYGELAHNLDRGSAEGERRYQVGIDLVPRVEAAVAFAADEILRIGKPRLDAWYRAEPRLERHRIRITRILREAPYTLPMREQALVASMARWPLMSSDVVDALHDSDLGWLTLKGPDGTETPITTYSYRQVPRELRAEATRKLLTRLKEFENLFGLLYTRRIDADLAIARHRRFAEGIDAIWFLRDGMPVGSARLVVEQARRNLPLVHRYLALRARALGAPGNSFWQIFTPPPDAGRSFGAGEAVDLAAEAMAPLGASFQQTMRDAAGAHWMHLPPWPAKRGVFEVFPAIGMPHPYMLTSFQPTYRGARQLAGGLLDMMKDAGIPADRYPDSRDDPPIYGNGIIYVGNMLFDDLVRSKAPDRRAKTAYAVQALDLIWSNFFQTALMMELDQRVQQLVIDGRPPGGREISGIFLALLREYAGPASPEEPLSAWWLTYDTTFYSYEHQFWAAAIASAANILEKIEARDPDGRKAVDAVYGRGDSDRSYYLLRQAGIDMADPKAYGALMRRMRKLLDELAELEGPEPRTSSPGEGVTATMRR